MPTKRTKLTKGLKPKSKASNIKNQKGESTCEQKLVSVMTYAEDQLKDELYGVEARMDSTPPECCKNLISYIIMGLRNPDDIKNVLRDIQVTISFLQETSRLLERLLVVQALKQTLK